MKIVVSVESVEWTKTSFDRDIVILWKRDKVTS